MFVATLLGCGPPAPSWTTPTQAGYDDLVRALAAERAAAPKTPWAANVRVTLHVPGRTVTGRGAVASLPRGAFRMILVGGPGATLLDIWVTRTRWRMAIPPLGRVLRGGTSAPPDLPVGFLRWWFCSPLEGTLAAATRMPDAGTLFLLRDGDAVVELRDGPRGLEASRRVGGRTQTVRQSRRSWLPGPGDAVHYEAEGGDVTVDLVVESLADEPPAAEAFVDPDVVDDTSGTAPEPGRRPDEDP
jgi:hypothetical protein